MNGGRGDAVLPELLRELVGTMLGAGEDEGLLDRVRAHQVREQLALPMAVDGVDDLVDQVDGGVWGCDLDRCRRGQQPLCEVADLVGEGRGEEQVLALGGEEGQDRADVADEAHVEHPIRLVEDEDLHAAEVDGSLAGVVEQPSWRGDHDLRVAAQGVDLANEADAAVDGGGSS